jgi:DNA-binding transcriptional MerR regulator
MRASTLANLLTQKKAAELMGVSCETLRLWARKDEGPPRIRIGKRYYYTFTIILQWQKARSMAS